MLVGWDVATHLLGFDGHPTVLYVRCLEPALEQVRAVLPATVNPQLPGLVQVSRPSDALIAKRATESAFGALLLGLAGVSLLVGGIGVANTMVICGAVAGPSICGAVAGGPLRRSQWQGAPIGRRTCWLRPPARISSGTQAGSFSQVPPANAVQGRLPSRQAVIRTLAAGTAEPPQPIRAGPDSTETSAVSPVRTRSPHLANSPAAGSPDVATPRSRSVGTATTAATTR